MSLKYNNLKRITINRMNLKLINRKYQIFK